MAACRWTECWVGWLRRGAVASRAAGVRCLRLLLTCDHCQSLILHDVVPHTQHWAASHSLHRSHLLGSLESKGLVWAAVGKTGLVVVESTH